MCFIRILKVINKVGKEYNNKKFKDDTKILQKRLANHEKICYYILA